MPVNDTPEIDTHDLDLPSGCRFRIWSRAELEVGDKLVGLEGRHAGLMLELLRNRGQRVAAPLLWAAMLGEGLCDPGRSILDVVITEINHVRYRLAARGIMLAIDDSQPEIGFMLSGLSRIEAEVTAPPVRRRSQGRKVHREISPPPVTKQGSRAGYCGDACRSDQADKQVCWGGSP